MAETYFTHPSSIVKISQPIRLERIGESGLQLPGTWLQEAGFNYGMLVKLRLMPGCLIITLQDLAELLQCVEGLSAEPLDPLTLTRWLAALPGGLITE